MRKPIEILVESFTSQEIASMAEHILWEAKSPDFVFFCELLKTEGYSGSIVKTESLPRRLAEGVVNSYALLSLIIRDDLDKHKEIKKLIKQGKV